MNGAIVRHLRRGEEGQDFLEFAIIIPIMVFVIMGIVDFGRVFNSWLTITHGAREGARVAAVGYGNAEVIARVDDVTPITVTVSIEPGPSACHDQRTTVGDPVTVTVSTSVTLLSTWMDAIFGIPAGGGVPVSAQGVARYEGVWVFACN